MCEPFQENVFEADNSTYALKGLLYLDTTCHFLRWKDTHLWKAFLGKHKIKYVLSLSYIYALIYYASSNKLLRSFAFLLY